MNRRGLPRLGFRAAARAFSLIEILVVVAIIAILAGMGLVYHQGALDASDIKFIMPRVADGLQALTEVANDTQTTMVIEFPEGRDVIFLTLTRGQSVPQVELDLTDRVVRPRWEITEGMNRLIRENGGNLNIRGTWYLKRQALLKRPLVWLDFETPTHADEPRTFTFAPNTIPQGGEVRFGSAFAQAYLRTDVKRIVWDMD